MATWKKIIVSGSQAQLAGVTGSFTGSFRGDGSGLTGVTAQASFPLTFGEGIGLTALGASSSYNGNQPVTISVSGAAALSNNIVTKWNDTEGKFQNSSLTDDGTNITGTTSIQLSGANSRLTGSFTGSFAGNLTGTSSFATTALTAINGGVTSVAGTVNEILVNGLTTGQTGAVTLSLPSTVDLGAASSFTATGLTGSLSASFVSSDLILGTQTKGDYVANITAGNGLASTGATTGENISHTLSVNAGAGISVTAPTSDAVNLDTGSAHFTDGVKTKLNTDVVISGSSWGSAVNFTSTTNRFTGSFTGSFSGDGSNLTGIATTLDVSASNGSGISLNLRTQDLTITGTANEIETSAAGTTLTIGLPNDITIGNNLSVTTNLTVGGNFTVNGTTTFVNTNDLYVEDQFIVLASGSAGNIDGGIAIDRGAYASGSVAYGYDSVTERWGYQNGLQDTTNAIVISNPTASAFINYGFTEATHGVRTGINGEFLKLGATYIDNAEDIWIFS